MNQKKSNNMMQKALKAGVCLFMLSGSCVLYAQNGVGMDSAKIANPQTKASAQHNYQTKEIKGVIYDASTRQPLAGVTVQALNNRYFTALTDENGAYTLKVPTFVTALYIKSDGYNAIQLPIRALTEQNASLQVNNLPNLYKDQIDIYSRKSISLENTSSLTVENEIGNNLNAVVHTTRRGGLPAQGGIMFINGLNSLNANAQPLVVIDGVIQDMQYDRSTLHDGFVNNLFNLIDPEDIENVEVLQNGLALYGAKGANGVLNITTKRGRSMVTKIKARLYGGFETKPALMSMMNGPQFRNYMMEVIGTTQANSQGRGGVQNSPFFNENPNYLYYPIYHNNEDWQSDLYRTSFTQNYKVSVEGGDDIAKYNLSLGYSKSVATIKNNDFDRLNLRFNTDVFMFKGFTTGIDVYYTRNAYNILDNGWASDYSQRNISSPNVLGAIQSPFVSKYAYYVTLAQNGLTLGHTDKVYTGKNYNNILNGLTFLNLVNPYWILENGNGTNKNYQEETQFGLNIAPRYRFNKYLTIENRFSYILTRANEKYYLPFSGTPEKMVEGLGFVSSVVRSMFSKETTLYDNLHITWTRNFGPHFVNLDGGLRIASYSFNDSHIAGFNNDNDKMPNMTYSLQYKQYGGNSDNWTNLTYYLNSNYNYRNRYFASFILSADASSRFGKDAEQGLKLFGVKWGIFPSLQLGWVISNEDWFKVKAINYLQLQGGIEVSGNDDVNYYATRTYFANTKFLDKATSLSLTNIKNPKIQWENTTKYNLGFNTHLFNNRLSLGLNFYQSKTTHLLNIKSVSDITGLAYMWSNDGALKNTGFDFTASAVLLNKKNWQWSAGATIGHYVNKITALPNTDLNYIKTYALDEHGHRIQSSESRIHGTVKSIDGIDNIATMVGHSAGVFYGYKTQGVFSSNAEASKAGKYGYLRYPTGLAGDPYRQFIAGDVHFVDVNGDGWISDADKVVIGNPNPKLYGNLFTTLTWKNLSLNLIFKYSLGNDIYNYQRAMLESEIGTYNQTTAVLNRWQFEGQKTEVPRAVNPSNTNWVNNERFSDRWIEDGSYLKMKKIRLTYNVPVSLSWLQGLSLWGEANDVFTVTKYLGKDPEVSSGNGVLYQGIDNGYLPTGHSFNFGVTINL